MAEESTTAEKAKAAEEPTYEVDRLIEESWGFLGCSRHVAAGAFHGQKKKNFTISEAKKIVKDWLKQPAETSEEVES